MKGVAGRTPGEERPSQNPKLGIDAWEKSRGRVVIASCDSPENLGHPAGLRVRHGINPPLEKTPGAVAANEPTLQRREEVRYDLWNGEARARRGLVGLGAGGHGSD